MGGDAATGELGGEGGEVAVDGRDGYAERFNGAGGGGEVGGVEIVEDDVAGWADGAGGVGGMTTEAGGGVGVGVALAKAEQVGDLAAEYGDVSRAGHGTSVRGACRLRRRDGGCWRQR